MCSSRRPIKGVTWMMRAVVVAVYILLTLESSHTVNITHSIIGNFPNRLFYNERGFFSSLVQVPRFLCEQAHFLFWTLIGRRILLPYQYPGSDVQNGGPPW